METMLRQPAVWRARAIEFWDQAQMATDFRLKQQYAELATRYLHVAEEFETEAFADIAGVPPAGRTLF